MKVSTHQPSGLSAPGLRSPSLFRSLLFTPGLSNPSLWLAAALVAFPLLFRSPALAHHFADLGQMKPTWSNGVISGLAHPLLGPDHLVFLLALSLVALQRRWGWALGLLLVGLLGGAAGLAWPGLPGAEALVARCAHRGIPMALATSSSRDAVALKTAPHPWLAPITTRVFGDDPGLAAGKPAPDVFLLAAERLGVQAPQCWAFEDSPAGARAATAAGCRVFVLAPLDLDARQRRDLYPASAELITTLADVPI